MTPLRRRQAARLFALAAAAMGFFPLERRVRRRRGQFRLFILEYHDVTGGAEVEGVVGAQRLRAHLRYLKRHFCITTLGEALRRMNRGGGLTEDLAVLTLDDGYAGNYEHAFPVFREAGVAAAVFLTTGFLDGEGLWFDRARSCLEKARRRRGELPRELRRRLDRFAGGRPGPSERLTQRLKYWAPEERDRLIVELEEVVGKGTSDSRPLTWDQVREMQSAGMEIGCHTVSHPVLSTLSSEHQEREIVRARDRIAEETGVRPTLFAYPNGLERDFTEETIAILRAADFACACTTMRGSNCSDGDRFRLRRLGVGAESRAMLASRLAGLFEPSRWRPGLRPSPTTNGASGVMG